MNWVRRAPNVEYKNEEIMMNKQEVLEHLRKVLANLVEQDETSWSQLEGMLSQDEIDQDKAYHHGYESAIQSVENYEDSTPEIVWESKLPKSMVEDLTPAQLEQLIDCLDEAVEAVALDFGVGQ